MVRQWFKAISILLLLGGCKLAPIRHIAQSPTVSVAPSGAVELSGDAQVAPKVDTKKSGGKLSIPEGSRFDFNEKTGVMSLVLSKATEMVVDRQETTVDGPVAFAPDKGPTIGEEKSAQADFWTMLGLRAGSAIGVALAIFGLVRGWDFVMYGGGALAGACLFGLFVQKHPILLIFIGLGVSAAVVGPWIYHTKIKKTTSSDAKNE
jgi:hypothetical protein